MKKKISILLFLIIIVITSLVIIIKNNNINKKEDYKTIKVAEVAHTIFYAPFYAAISKGYFEEENLSLIHI